MIKLFRAKSIVECRGYKGVTLYWFVEGREQPLAPYSELIKDYDPTEPSYAEGAIKEDFSEEEIKLFEEYFNRMHPGDKLEIKEVDLPISHDMAGFGAIGSGVLDGYYDLYREEGYNLPFKVSAYYDLEDNEDFQEKVKAKERNEKKKIEEIPIDELRSLAINDLTIRRRLLEILEKKR